MSELVEVDVDAQKKEYRKDYVTKKELINECMMYSDCTLTARQLTEAHDVLFRAYLHFLVEHRNIRLPFLCSIRTWQADACQVRNPKTGEYMERKPYWAVRVYINEGLRRIIKRMEVEEDV